jgi:hypothetical protein
MSNSYRSHRRRKKSSAGKLGLAGALTGAVGIAAVAVGIVLLRPGPDDGKTATPTLASQGDGAAGNAPSPQAGPTLSVTTPEGYGYGLAAARAGTNTKPLPTSSPAPSGSTYAYADYVLTNTQKRPVLLDFPADLFLPKSEVPAEALDRCMPQPGVPSNMCTLPNHSRVTARLSGAKPPISENGDTLMPAGASYLVRIATDLPVKDGLKTDNVKLYVWDARFTSDRKGIELSFPS